MHFDLGPANHHAALCFSRVRWLSPVMRELLHKEGLWEDLIQELYAAAFFAWQSGMDDTETRRYAARRLYACLKSYGFRQYNGRYFKREKPFSSVFSFNIDDHLDEKILALLRKHPEGLPRSKLTGRFQIPVYEVNRILAPMIKEGKVVEIKRENTRGRPLSPLLVVIEPGQTLPEPKMAKAEQRDCIRQDYHLLSLNKLLEDGDGHKSTSPQDQIADDKAIDLDARLDAKRILQGLPKRVVQIGYKVYAGIPLQMKEKKYLKHWQKAHPAPIVAGIYYPGERILEILRKNPEGMTRRVLSARLQVPVQEVDWHLAPMIKQGKVVEIKRENTRGRPQGPLFLIAGTKIPQGRMVKAERDDRIRRAHFVEGRGIKRIAREFHHCRRTVRKAIAASTQEKGRKVMQAVSL